MSSLLGLAKREAVFAEVEARLKALTSAAEVERMPSGDPTRFPALGIEEGDQTADGETEPGVNRYDLQFIVEGYVQGSGGAETHAAINALYLEVVTALMASPDELGGLVEEMQEGRLRVTTALLANKRRVGFVLEWNVRFPANTVSPAAD